MRHEIHQANIKEWGSRVKQHKLNNRNLEEARFRPDTGYDLPGEDLEKLKLVCKLWSFRQRPYTS